jgi:hypothetical protein
MWMRRSGRKKKLDFQGGHLEILIVVGIALVSSAYWHHYFPKYVAASLAAALTTEIVFQVIVYVQLGFLDPFFLVAVFTSGALALVIAFLVGLPIRSRRKRGLQSQQNEI